MQRTLLYLRHIPSVSIALCIAGILNSSAANWMTAVKGAFSLTFRLEDVSNTVGK